MSDIFNINNVHTEELKIFEACLSGLLTSLRNIASTPGKTWKVESIAGPQYFRELAREEGTPKLPFIGVIVTAMRPNEEMPFNEQALYNGIYMGKTDDKMSVILHLRPIAVDLQIIVVAQSLDDIMSFAQRWLFRERQAQFTIACKGYTMDVKVKFNSELGIPEEDFSEMGNLFNFSLTATFYAHVGVMELRPIIKGVTFKTNIVDPGRETKSQVFSKNIPLKTE